MVLQKYRSEIDGLRAFAVLGVVFFHLGISAFSGGFVGVDVFFVISGYLITRNIMSAIARGNFSFVNFYARRARRIFPALFATVIVTFMSACLWLAPDALQEAAKECVRALLSVSNIYYWIRSSQYFAPAANELLLLHFWSLSLEEQFYLVWPAALVLAYLYKRKWVVAVALAGLLSLGFAEALVRSGSNNAAFFLMPFRVYEFAMGAFVVFSEQRFPASRRAAEFMTAAGLVFIAFACMVFSASMPFPGLSALVPCIGAGLIIHAGATTGANLCLANEPTRRLGLISYSVYLCHWPILFFTSYVFGRVSETAIAKCGVLVVTFAAASVLFECVEKPFRKPRGDVRRLASVVAALTVVGLTPIYLASRQSGWPWRLSIEKQERTEQQRFGFDPCSVDASHCTIGAANGRKAVALIGDSFAQHYVSGLDARLKREGLSGVVSTYGGCFVLVGIDLTTDRAKRCSLFRDQTLDALGQDDTPVILAQSWNGYSAGTFTNSVAPKASIDESTRIELLRYGVEQTLDVLSKTNRRIMIVGAQVKPSCHIDKTRRSPGPLWHRPPQPCTAISLDDARLKTGAINTMLKEIRDKRPDLVSLLLPEDYLCTPVCRTQAQDGTWLYFDDEHFSSAGGKWVIDRAKNKLDALIGARTPNPD